MCVQGLARGQLLIRQESFLMPDVKEVGARRRKKGSSNLVIKGTKC